ncbi:hypothetical protein HUSEC_02388 [Escherichia coli O104:H4 str. LB226692]|nr:hypothetical protein HUSEC_02388 [Escherichia coli O104:H4 str. LB226692]
MHMLERRKHVAIVDRNVAIAPEYIPVLRQLICRPS